jgi:hypothetical protein
MTPDGRLAGTTAAELLRNFADEGLDPKHHTRQLVHTLRQMVSGLFFLGDQLATFTKSGISGLVPR